MNRGDLLLISPGTHVGPASRYSQGLVIEAELDRDSVKITWADGYTSVERYSNIVKYYVRVFQ